MLRSQRGFTLVEILVAMALLSMVMLGLLTAMRSFAQTETRIDERIRIDDDLRVSERFLRAVVSTVSPRTRPAAAGEKRHIDFVGGADAMRWIGVMPARHGAGGLYRFSLFARPAGVEGPMALVLEFAPFVPGSEAPADSALVQSRVMAADIRGILFRYQDGLDSGEQWLEQWPHLDRLPQRIGLSVLGAAQPWPEIVVAVLPVIGSLPPGRGGVAVGPVIGPL